jgi:hypothetical protein
MELGVVFVFRRVRVEGGGELPVIVSALVRASELQEIQSGRVSYGHLALHC